MKKLYTKVSKQNTIKEFIIKLFKYGYLNDISRCTDTYLNKECTQLENRLARRSFEDLLIIVNTVYKNVSEKKLAKILYELSNEEILGKVLRVYYCETICKHVFKYYNNNKYWISNLYKMGSNGKERFFNIKGNGQYSLQDILDLAGFKNNYNIN